MFMLNQKEPAFEAIIGLFCALFLAISCSPIKPGEGGSAAATASDTSNKGDDSMQGNARSGSQSGTSGTADADNQESANIDSSLPTNQNSGDAELTQRYNFAAVCGPLFGKSNDESGSREAVLTNEETEASVETTTSGEAECLEGPSISSFRAVQAFTEYDQRKAACLADNGFWDPRGEDLETGEKGECFGLGAPDEVSSDLFCAFDYVENQMSGVFGIDGFIEGYQNLGWQIEQCVFSPSGPYLTLSTVVIDKAESLAHKVCKVAFLEKISVVCDGKSGGVCEQAESNPNAEVLFLSAPVICSNSKTVAELEEVLAQ